MDISRRSLLKGLAAAGVATTVGASPDDAGARHRQMVEPQDVGMLYDSTLCIGCKACVTKCKEVNGLPATVKHYNGGMYDAPSDLDGATKNIIKLYAEGNKRAFMKMQCMQCGDPACVSVCMAGALHKIDKGIVAYNKNTCVGCRYCQIACPFDVPKFQWLTAIPLIVKCELCRHRKEGPGCCEVCPRKAVIYGKMEELKKEARNRISKSPDLYAAKVYGENDGGGTHVLYLTAKDIPFEKLGLPDLPEEPLPQMSETIQHTLYKGFLAPLALYGIFTFAQYRNAKKRGADEAAARGKEVQK
jgi:Fe-S-cluster-containing dehydrogenase component